jgi:hypothetical protein
MKVFRKAMRIWIAIASVFSFLGGWAILAHSPKPVQPATIQPAALPALPPIQAFGSEGNSTGPGFFSPNSQTAPQQSSGFPLLRTRGS